MAAPPPTPFRSGIFAAQVSRGEARLVRLPRELYEYPREAIVLRTNDGELRAYLNECRHLPIPLDVTLERLLDPDGEHLTCATHGACYRVEDGFCIGGPCAGDSLEAIALDASDGEIVLALVPQAP